MDRTTHRSDPAGARASEPIELASPRAHPTTSQRRSADPEGCQAGALTYSRRRYAEVAGECARPHLAPSRAAGIHRCVPMPTAGDGWKQQQPQRATETMPVEMPGSGMVARPTGESGAHE